MYDYDYPPPQPVDPSKRIQNELRLLIQSKIETAESELKSLIDKAILL